MKEHQNVVSYFKNTEEYTVRNPIIQLRKKIIQELLPDINGQAILDVGCGEGSLTTDFIMENKVTFLDITSEMLEQVKSKIPEEYGTNADFVNIDIMDFKSVRQFDIIVCVGVFAHVHDLNALMQKLKGLIKNDGLIVIQYTNAKNLITKINLFKIKHLAKSRYSHQLNIHSKKHIKEIIKINNLNCTITKSYWPIFPFLSPFSYSQQLRLIFFCYNSILSYLGSEKVCLLNNKESEKQ